MTIDATMQAVIAVLFGTATGAIGWLVTKIWTERADMQAKFIQMLEKQFDDAARRKEMFDNLAQTVRELSREVQAFRAEMTRTRT
jgi:polyhydroxyalkanoate synthesis regulator phasin